MKDERKSLLIIAINVCKQLLSLSSACKFCGADGALTNAGIVRKITISDEKKKKENEEIRRSRRYKWQVKALLTLSVSVLFT